MSCTRRRTTTTIRDHSRRVIALPDFEEQGRTSGIGRMLTGLGLAQARLEALAAAEHTNQVVEPEAGAAEHEEDDHV